MNDKLTPKGLRELIRSASIPLAPLMRELGIEAVDDLERHIKDAESRVQAALELAVRYGGIDGDHHKAWVIDQMVRALTGTQEAYEKFVANAKDGEDGPETYRWEVGIPP